MTIPLKQAVTDVSLQLQDSEFANFTADEVVSWFEEGLGVIATLRPDLMARIESIRLQPGSLQKVDGRRSQVLQVHSVRDDEDAPVNALTRFHLGHMRSFDPQWQRRRPGRAVQYALATLPNAFWVYPPQPDPPQYADVEFTYVPDLARPDSDGYDEATIGLDRRYFNALIEYALYRAMAKDADFGGSDQKAVAHYQAFRDAVAGTLRSAQDSQQESERGERR